MAESEERYASTIVIHRHHMNVLFESYDGRLLSPSMNPSATTYNRDSAKWDSAKWESAKWDSAK